MRFLFFFLLSSQVFAQSTNVAELKKNLASLYPEISKEVVEAKIKNSLTVHDFYRAFVRLYYQNLKLKTYNDLRPLETVKGVLAGDPHAENFGCLASIKGKNFPSLNDFDDAGKGPVIHDLLRFLVSAKYALQTSWNGHEHIEDLYEAYSDGLEDKNHSYSKVMDKLIEQSKKNGLKLNEKYVDKDKKTFIKKKDGELPLSSTERQDVISKLKYIGYNVHDIYKRAKMSGGSAGIPRYEVLATKDKLLSWITVKQMYEAGVSMYTNLHPTPLERLKMIKEKILNDKLPELDMVHMGSKDYFIRFEWSGNSEVELATLKSNEIESLLMDEAYILGKIHRRSLKDLGNKSLEPILNLNLSTLELALNNMSDSMAKDYKALKP